MRKFGEVTVGRIGCFKSDIIPLPSISDIASDREREIDTGRGVTKLEQRHIQACLHARVDQQRADHVLISRELIAFLHVTTKCLFIRDCTYC